MIKRTSKIIVFFLILIILIQIINHYYKEKLYDSTLEIQDRTLYKNENIDILIMGSSHANLGLEPEMIKDSFNYAGGGERFFERFHKLKSIIDINKIRPKIIIMDLDPESFLSYGHSKNFWYWGRYINYVNIAYKTKKISFLKKEIKSRIYFLGKGVKLFKPKYENKETIFKGHIRSFEIINNITTEQPEHRTKSMFEDKNGNKLDAFSKFQVTYFEKTLDLAQENNITIVFIKFPLTKEYLDALKKYIPNMNHNYKITTNITKGYNNIYIIDYQDVFIDNYTLFKDYDHLNAIGALELSYMVNNNLASIK